MTSKERVLTALRHEKPDRVPFNIWMDRRTMDGFARRYGDEFFRVTEWGADVIEAFAALVFPTGESHAETGTSWQLEPYLKDWSDAGNLVLPDPDDDNVYAGLRATLERFPDHAVLLDMPSSWGYVSGIRTFELLFMDMVDHAQEVKDLSQRITDIQLRATERAIQEGVTAVYIMEDLTSTMGPMMSPAFIEEFCLVYAKQLADLAKEHNLPVFFHCCGKAESVMDQLAGIGIDAVNPLQPHLNDLDAFAHNYGDRLTLYGGLDNTYAIPEGPVERIREHVIDIWQRVGPNGGLIFSTHDIPIETPEEHIFAVLDAITNDCRYA